MLTAMKYEPYEVNVVSVYLYTYLAISIFINDLLCQWGILGNNAKQQRIQKNNEEQQFTMKTIRDNIRYKKQQQRMTNNKENGKTMNGGKLKKKNRNSDAN